MEPIHQRAVRCAAQNSTGEQANQAAQQADGQEVATPAAGCSRRNVATLVSEPIKKHQAQPDLINLVAALQQRLKA